MNEVRPLPGNGIVAYENGFMLVCGEGELVDELLALVHEVASSGGDGRMLVRRGNRTLAGDADAFDCAMAAPTQGGIAVLVSGTATASATGATGDVFLDGRNAITTQDALVPGPITKLELRLPDAGKADPRWRLDSGVVPGGGLEGIPQSGSERSGEGMVHREPESTVSDFAATPEGADYLDQVGEDQGAPAGQGSMMPEFPQPPAGPEFPAPPPAPDYAQQPDFPPPPDYPPPPDQFAPPAPDYGAPDQFAPPAPDYGAPDQFAPDQFGQPGQDFGQPASDQFGPSPGMLVLDDGMTLQLDADYLVGRDPERAAEVQSGEARPIRLTDAEGSVSRRHARVSVEGGEVRLTDLGSVNGTHIQAPGQAGFYPIQPNEPVTITPGTQVLIGGTRIFRYDPAS